MLQILKWSIPIDGKRHKINTKAVKVLTVENQNGNLVFWTESDCEDNEQEFVVLLTGQLIAEDLNYVGTALFDTYVNVDSSFVSHLYVSSK